MSNLQTTFCGQKLQNPIITASGTFSATGSGKFYDFTKLGAITTKGMAINPWPGNPTPRIAEARSGMLNAVGLENPGVKDFAAYELPFIKDKILNSAAAAEQKTKIIANVAGKDISEYVQAAEFLSTTDVDMLELNISCPNVKEGGLAFGTSPQVAAKVTGAVRRVVNKPLIVKLAPNVTDICEDAKAVEAAGADAVSLINTLSAMRIDVKNRRHILANKIGGLSGPAIFPIAVRMVYQVARAVKIPILGMGGVKTGADAAELLMAGAAAIAVGTAALVDPTAPLRILDELEKLMNEYGFVNIEEIKNGLQE